MMSIEKGKMTEAITYIQSMVKDFPPTTPQICRLVVDYFLDVMLAYQSWTKELQDIILTQESDIKKMRNTIEIQSKTLETVFHHEN